MKKGLFLYLIAGFFAIHFIGENTANGMGNQKDNLNIDKLIEQVKNEGAIEVINTLYSDDETWQQCLDKVATANPKWIKLAVLLRPHSDAGISNMLDLCRGVAH